MVNLITSYTVLENKEKTFTKYKLSCNWCSFPFFRKVPYVLMKINTFVSLKMKINALRIT